MASITLFDYQQEALQAVVDGYAANIHRQLICLPTGTGKTIIMAAIAKHFNKRTLILAHREELIKQAKAKIKLYWKRADIGIVKAEQNEVGHNIIIGSVPTCSRPKRLEQLKEQNFEILIIDEAHHAAADTYQRIIEELGFKNQGKLLIGVTATPERNDDKGLLDVFEKIVFSRSISTMIDAGYLVPVHGRKILTTCSLKNVKTYNGDFAIRTLSHAVNVPKRNELIVDKYIQHASGRKAIAFCVDVKHAQDLASTFNTKEIKAEPVWGEMPSDQRIRVLRDLKNGKVDVVTTCNVLLEGFDEPSVNCILMSRPTKSKSLYIQAVGRGLRKNGPVKKDCFVLDFLDTYHNLNAIALLQSTIPTSAMRIDEQEKTLNVGQNKHADENIAVKQHSDVALDILGKSRFTWIDIGEGEYSLNDDMNNEIVIRPQDDGYVADLYHNGIYVPLVADPIPLDYCTGVCEDYARRNLKISYADTHGEWLASSRNKPPTIGQIEKLREFGINANDLDKAQAALEIRTQIALKKKMRRNIDKEPMTHKQRYFLLKSGINQDLSKAQASYMITQIKKGLYGS